MTRRHFLRTAALSLGAAVPAHAVASSLSLQRSFHRIPCPAECPGLSGMRIGFVSDLHRSRLVSREDVEAVAAALNQEEVDLLAVGGDLISAPDTPPELMDEVLEILGTVRAPLGRFVVRGNHDISRIPGRTFRNASRYGIQPLINAGVSVERSGSHLFVAGMDDHGMGEPDPARTFREHQGEPVLFLTHNPDGVMERLDAAPPTWLALCGHLHGGQVRIPFWGAPYLPTAHPDVFDQGFTRPKGRLTYVSRGTGVVSVPLRLWCPPEICIFEVA